MCYNTSISVLQLEAERYYMGSFQIFVSKIICISLQNQLQFFASIHIGSFQLYCKYTYRLISVLLQVYIQAHFSFIASIHTGSFQFFL